jgi:ribonuclease HII
MVDFSLEAAVAGRVAGIDEVGRGPLAGPVMAAAVVFSAPVAPALAALIDDSKRLSPARRDIAFAALIAARAVGGVEIGVGAASVAEISRLNILGATLLAMRRAAGRLAGLPDLALVDGNRPPALDCAVRCVVGGDRRCLSIAAASIVAKVVRDRLMARLATRYPAYGWERNAGYGTSAHLAALAAHGASPHHRPTFAPVRQRVFSDLP